MATNEPPVEAGVSQALSETPEHPADEAAVAAESPVDDRRRPRLRPGLDGEPMTLEDIRDRLHARFPDVGTEITHGELTVHATADQVHPLIEFARDDEQLCCLSLVELCGVHWPAGDHVIERQPSTTGWPEHRVSRDQGVIEVQYVLRSLDRNHWFRVSVGVPDDAPAIPTVTDLFPTANWLEREAYDMFGVEFVGHPGLNRILMPEDWVGHPQRKDYPLGGVTIDYENDKFIPPPQQRSLREVVGGDG